MWFRRIDGLTSSPLLDLPPSLGPRHPYLKCMRHGDRSPPEPFARLADWATEQFGKWGGPFGAASARCGVRSWRYVRSDYPQECLIHLVAEGTRYCFTRGRQHKSHSVMLTVDLVAGVAWQRCYDAEDCVETLAGDGAVINAKHLIFRTAASALPICETKSDF